MSSEDLHEGFYQETNFLYLTGWNEPGAVLMMTPKEEIFLAASARSTHRSFHWPQTWPR